MTKHSQILKQLMKSEKESGKTFVKTQHCNVRQKTNRVAQFIENCFSDSTFKMHTKLLAVNSEMGKNAVIFASLWGTLKYERSHFSKSSLSLDSQLSFRTCTRLKKSDQSTKKNTRNCRNASSGAREC